MGIGKRSSEPELGIKRPSCNEKRGGQLWIFMEKLSIFSLFFLSFVGKLWKATRFGISL